MSRAASIVLKKVVCRVMVSAHPCILYNFIGDGKCTSMHIVQLHWWW